jgi:5-methyltetrahydrofolate--homocysteine methyltransferase
MFNYDELTSALISGKAPVVRELTEKALAEGEIPQDVLTKGLVAGMAVVGQRFKDNEFYVPEVLIAARAMKNGMEVLRPKLIETGVKPVAKVAIGTVRGDLHDIGKNLVAMMMEGAGFEIIDLGVDVKPEQFVAAVKDKGAGLICLSALLTTTMPAMGETIGALQQAGVRDGVKVMIGGAPVTQNYADEIKADGYAPDAASAVDSAKMLLQVA